ncbi:MAG TPA: patatin-like phospholipase family protein [Bryobacteraceae bacterium]|nr:patatin-like phospholipase family protein [Bryobacteraceae bacterium]
MRGSGPQACSAGGFDAQPARKVNTRRAGGFFDFFRALTRSSPPKTIAISPPAPPKIGLALGGGFARGIAHAGLLQVFEKHHIPVHCITGVSAGSIVAAAYASGASPEEIARAGCSMRFGDVGSWSLGRMGFMASERMKKFLERLLKAYRFEEMRIPLGVLATDLVTGEPVRFYGTGDVVLPIRASCAYPGLFHPIRSQDRLLVDGAMSVEVPARLARQLGATHVISVHLPVSRPPLPRNVFQVVNRCFQILSSQTEETWRRESDLVIAPEVGGIEWDGFACGPDLLLAGEAAALAALPHIQQWLSAAPHAALLTPANDRLMPGSAPA